MSWGRARPVWEASTVWAAVTGVQYWKAYLLTERSYVFSIRLIKVILEPTPAISLALFLNWFINQTGKKNAISWEPSKTLTGPE